MNQAAGIRLKVQAQLHLGATLHAGLKLVPRQKRKQMDGIIPNLLVEIRCLTGRR